jgi:hypothetical protein
MLGNGMMGAGMIAGPAVFFGFFVWSIFLTIVILTCFWMIRTARGFREKYNALREPVIVYGNGGVLNIEVVTGRIRTKESKKKGRAA